MQKSLDEQIERAKQLLKICKHAAMATVNEDGSPHNTPYLFMRDEMLEHVYWGSHPHSVHSKNILRSGQLFIVLYQAEERGGLFIQAENGHVIEGEELRRPLEIHNQLRLSHGQDTLSLDYYSGGSPQRMWTADIKRLWVNGTKRGEDGLIIEDIRTEITTHDLLG
jgi:hypothetical protein